MRDESGSEIIDNAEAGQYELRRDGLVVGVVEYRLAENVMTIPHVEVVPALRGHGVSGPFLDDVLALARERGLKVRPLCGYARGRMLANDAHRELLA